MAKESTIARESKANPLNAVSSRRRLDYFDMLTTDSKRRREIRQRMDELSAERKRKLASAPPGANVNYSYEFWKLQRELWTLNGVL